jgi:hypothetical protein
MPLGSNQGLTDINTEYLCQRWVNSYEEEEQTDEVEIYRPIDFKKFRPSRFRMKYVFHRNGDCDWYARDPRDAHHFKPGKWRVDPNDKSTLQIIKDGRTELFRVIELKKDILRIARIKPNT